MLRNNHEQAKHSFISFCSLQKVQMFNYLLHFTLFFTGIIN